MSQFTDTQMTQAEQRSQAFEGRIAVGLNTERFWAEEIKRLRNEPLARFHMAIDYLPSPAAFTEAAIALRTLIRERRKRGESFVGHLSLLYALSALESFFFATDYLPELGEPSFNVAEIIPKEEWPYLKYAYSELGYKNLRLLKKTDRMWLVETWGEPSAHTTLRHLHEREWDWYYGLLRALRSRQRARFEHELQQLEVIRDIAESTQPEFRQRHAHRESSYHRVLAFLKRQWQRCRAEGKD